MWDLGILFIPPLEEDHIPKLLKKKIQKERVENVMKNGGQRIAIDFTLSEDMSNKVGTFSFQFCMKPELLFFLVLFVCFLGEREEFYGILWRLKKSHYFYVKVFCKEVWPFVFSAPFI